MRYTYDRTADAVYIYLVPEIRPGEVHRTYSCDPHEAGAEVNLDFDVDGMLVGIEILDASRLLPRDFLKAADQIGKQSGQ
jgi:uncharacterized protein YuzE